MNTSTQQQDIQDPDTKEKHSALVLLEENALQLFPFPQNPHEYANKLNDLDQWREQRSMWKPEIPTALVELLAISGELDIGEIKFVFHQIEIAHEIIELIFRPKPRGFPLLTDEIRAAWNMVMSAKEDTANEPFPDEIVVRQAGSEPLIQEKRDCGFAANIPGILYHLIGPERKAVKNERAR